MSYQTNHSESLPITFRFTRGFKLSVIFSAILFFALATAAIYVGIIDRVTPNQNAVYVVGIAILFVLLGLYQIKIVPRLFDTIAITESRIAQQSPNGHSVSMQWDDIASIRERDFLGRLELVSKASGKTIFIEYQLNDFPKLVYMIQHYTMSTETKG
jgi:hypothetical protein